MIRLTPIEKEVLTALRTLTSSDPLEEAFTCEEIYTRRMLLRGGMHSSKLLKTTHQFLQKLEGRVPSLVERRSGGWGLLTVGEVIIKQLKLEDDFHLA